MDDMVCRLVVRKWLIFVVACFDSNSRDGTLCFYTHRDSVMKVMI